MGSIVVTVSCSSTLGIITIPGILYSCICPVMTCSIDIFCISIITTATCIGHFALFGTCGSLGLLTFVVVAVKYSHGVGCRYVCCLVVCNYGISVAVSVAHKGIFVAGDLHTVYGYIIKVSIGSGKGYVTTVFLTVFEIADNGNCLVYYKSVGGNVCYVSCLVGNLCIDDILAFGSIGRLSIFVIGCPYGNAALNLILCERSFGHIILNSIYTETFVGCIDSNYILIITVDTEGDRFDQLIPSGTVLDSDGTCGSNGICEFINLAFFVISALCESYTLATLSTLFVKSRSFCLNPIAHCMTELSYLVTVFGCAAGAAVMEGVVTGINRITFLGTSRLNH